MQYVLLMALGAYIALNFSEILWAVLGFIVLLPFLILYCYWDDKRDTTNDRRN